ncbi:MAG: polysaccharide biosynthesis C-terminal domain-containing protein [Lachnospiraceae bacterium]|nr:polysaccharide biosynthesis C-terminal domain-containing protein [Lachnospiraceae bacterium]
MEGQERKVRERRGNQKDFYLIVGIFTYIGCLIFRIPLFYLIGEKGVGYFGIVYEIYIVISFFFSYGLSEATASLVRYRMKRDQYKNAKKVLRGAMLLAIAIGGLVSVCLLLFGNIIATNLLHMTLSTMAIGVMAPAVVFCLLNGVLKGYFQGNGSKVPAMHSKVLELIFMSMGGLIGAAVLHGYGEKVSALLQNENYAASYGAMGASIGILASNILCFLHLGLLYLLFSRRSKKQDARDFQKYTEKSLHILHMLVSTALPYAVGGLVFHSLNLTDGVMLAHTYKGTEDVAYLWGNYYGKYVVVIFGIAAILSLLSIEHVRRIVYWIEREEYRAARDRIKIALQECVIWTVPAAIFTAVLAENTLDVLFKGNNMSTAAWVMWGSLTIVFYVVAMIMSNLLLRLRKTKYVIGCSTAAFFVHVVLVYILLTKTGLGVVAIVIGNIVFYAIIAVTCFVCMAKNIQYSQEWIRSLAFPLVAAGISGLIIMLLNKAFVSLVGSVLSLIICLPVGIAAYVVLLLVLRCVSEKELQNMFLGRILIGMAKALHLL